VHKKGARNEIHKGKDEDTHVMVSSVGLILFSSIVVGYIIVKKYT